MIYQIKNFLARKTPRRIVVGFVTGLLKVNERLGDPNDLRLKRLTVQTGAELWRDIVTGKLLSHFSHDAMTKCPRQAVPQRVSVSPGDHTSHRIVNQQVKESVVRSRDTTAQACLQRSAWFLGRQTPGLSKQILG